MDKETIVIKYEQTEIEDIETDVSELNESNSSQEDKLLNMKNQINELYKATGKRPVTHKKSGPKLELFKMQKEKSFDELFQQAQTSLKKRGLSADELDYQDLVSEEELTLIEKELNAPIPRDYKWTKGDYIVVFTAALVGCVADVILSNRDNKFTGQNSKFSKKLNELHEKTFKHKSGAPIDYQGAHFGGGHHRELSKGHDLARFVEGIKSFKNGTFEAVRYENGVRQIVKMAVNQFGNSYEQLPMLEAIIEYAHHMFADLFSTYSLPFPGYSFFTESKNREFRKLAADMYNNGFNLKNVLTQSLSATIIEIIIRIYFGIQSITDSKEQYEIKEDYSNWQVIKDFVKPQKKDKLNEMLLVSHTIVAAENAGKIVIKCIMTEGIGIGKALSEINIAEILSVVRYGASVVKATYARNNEYAKIIHSTDQILENWEEMTVPFISDTLADTQEILVV